MTETPAEKKRKYRAHQRYETIQKWDTVNSHTARKKSLRHVKEGIDERNSRNSIH
jgi:hypothetical protein